MSTEFTQEMGALIRSLERRVREDPELVYPNAEDPLRHIENAIVTLVALHIKLRKS